MEGFTAMIEDENKYIYYSKDGKTMIIPKPERGNETNNEV
jgi:hypothetical protein